MLKLSEPIQNDSDPGRGLGCALLIGSDLPDDPFAVRHDVVTPSETRSIVGSTEDLDRIAQGKTWLKGNGHRRHAARTMVGPDVRLSKEIPDDSVNRDNAAVPDKTQIDVCRRGPIFSAGASVGAVVSACAALPVGL